MCVCLSAIFQVYSMILASVRQGVILPPPPHTTIKQTHKKPTQIRYKFNPLKNVKTNWLFDLLLNKLFFQETHSNIKDEGNWKYDFNGQIFFKMEQLISVEF